MRNTGILKAAQENEGDQDQGTWHRHSYPISRFLPAVLGGLIFATVVPILVTSYLINRSNADALLSARAELLVDGLENQLRGLLDPVTSQLEVARIYIEGRSLDVEDETRFQTYIEGILGGAPQVTSMGIIRPDGSMRRWELGRDGAIEEPTRALPLVDEVLAAAQELSGVFWSAPIVASALSDTILNPGITIRRDGEFYGILTVGVTGKRLSDYVAGLSHDNVTGFILYDRDKLIAYPELSNVVRAQDSSKLPTIADSTSSVIRHIWSEQNRLTQASRMVRTEGHWANIDGAKHAFFYREIEGYAPENLLVGVAVPLAESMWFRWAAAIAAALGFVLLLVAVGFATLLGRRIALPVVQLENALGKLEAMDFGDVSMPAVKRSRITEWQRSAERLAKAARALAAFNQYVPGKLARRLMSSPEDAAMAQQRDVTVMFIDLEGFSVYAANNQAADVANGLNTIFATIGPIIEHTGGVIDKYTGDGLMAFWGAPDELKDHVSPALAAALNIKEALSEGLIDGAARRLPRMRIGISTGSAIVGNLGFEGRWNYTLVGQTVNRAEQVEQNLRGFLPDRPVIIGLTTEVAKLCGAHGLPLDAKSTCVNDDDIVIL
ncbi:hypothetical protein J7444_20025 [Labrenzia sp. R4_1]|uniref:adenylate/guanylate cyclase domain-containing protein n=1 Tax=Labrenzia sp. R4_1 TaxID=2821106 RepID=UPI001AD98AAD|nr:adenylate/guanylate cyclase domain-containing protein [Labrenzia sp. R4_1]MBO9427034.1 hypothetical protein [Labrenzia sp. R4_1]